MPALEDIEEQTLNLKGKRGFRWVREFRFWQDAAHTIPWDLDGCTGRFVVDDELDISEGAGVSITGNTLKVELTPVQMRIEKDAPHHYLTITQPGEDPLLIFSGTLSISDP